MSKNNFATTFTLLIVVQFVSTLRIISRDEWLANPAKNKIIIHGKLPFVIIHHSESPSACYTIEDCKRKMRIMQNYHQNVRKWSDIGYSFVIGGDNNIYEGRGFNVVGAHAPKYNDKSVGICLMGNWNETLPPAGMLDLTKELIQYGIDEGHLERNYKIYGHRQVRNTDCPGDALYTDLEGWPHFSHDVDN